MRRKVVVIGIDGTSYDLLIKMIKAEKLPTFERILREGVSGTLTSVIPPTSAAAWSSAYTGNNPGKTGVYSFQRKKKNEYQFIVNNSDQRAGRDVWEVASSFGKRCLIVGMPFIFPPRPVNGVLIGGFFSLDLEPSIYPPSIREEIIDKLNYRVLRNDCKAQSEFEASIENRFQVANYLRERYDWDLLMIGFEQMEVACHNVWKTNIVPKLYELLDGQLACFLKQIPESATVLIHSDHGHIHYSKVFNLNNWLIYNRYLFLKKNVEIQRKRLTNIVRCIFIEKWDKYKDSARGAARVILSPLISFLERKRDGKLGSVHLDEIFDLTNSYAFARPENSANFGMIYLNVKGRERQGIIDGKQEYKSLCNEISRKLLDLRDPITGRRVIRRVWRKKELYHGPYCDEMFDLIFEAERGYFVNSLKKGIVDFADRNLSKIVYRGDLSHHELHGVILGFGHGIRRAEKVNTRITNIMPTILYAIGLPIPKGLDGHVIEEMFNENYLSSNPVKYTDIDLGNHKDDVEQRGYSMTEQEKIRERLKALGYI